MHANLHARDYTMREDPDDGDQYPFSFVSIKQGINTLNPWESSCGRFVIISPIEGYGAEFSYWLEALMETACANVRVELRFYLEAEQPDSTRRETPDLEGE